MRTGNQKPTFSVVGDYAYSYGEEVIEMFEEEGGATFYPSQNGKYKMFSAKTDKYDGYVYPYLMASFINANLRQNGVTRATQKIAYNLVKELLSEINKGTIGTIKYKYDEKTKKAYGRAIDSITNGEIIRLYNMLT